jgi:flagellar biosynthetic protein FlhB
MGGSGGGQEKTEKATPKKRRDAREKEGNVLQSKDISSAATLFFLFFTLFIVGRYMFQQLMNVVADRVSVLGDYQELNTEFFLRLMRTSAIDIVTIVFPLAAVAVTVPLITGAIQTKLLFTMKPLKPKFSKLNPITGMKRLFSMQTVVNVIKGVVVIGIIGIIVFNRISSRMADFHRMLDMAPQQGILYIGRSVFEIVMLILMIFVFVAAADYLWQWYQYEKKLKMSKQEVKDEYKQIEGDPLIKSKIKQKQREVSMKRMMEQVPGADVIVRNPTHFAVALTYDKENTLVAPKVVAKGKDAIALRIIEIGEKNDVFVAENRPLARELYETVEIGREIPPSLYNAIAVILTDMYSHKGITLDN